MALVFSLSAECGIEQNTAEQFAQHFDGLTWVLSNDKQSQCRTRVFQDIDQNWWCQVYPDNLSIIGIDVPESAYSMTELGILLYQRLLSAPPYRYALVGVEVDEFRVYSELDENISKNNIPGLVLAEAHWRSYDLSSFCPFSFGYVWHPYEGEVYKPLTVSSVLKNKLNELLVFN